MLNLWSQVECSDYDSDGSHDLIGSFETTVEQLLQGANKPVLSYIVFLYLCLKELCKIINFYCIYLVM